jgi:hypothetical protein
MNNETALQVINDASRRGSLICFDKANGFPDADLYRVEITQMCIDKDKDCYEINKKFMPKKEIVDRIGEASGVIFVNGETRRETVEDAVCSLRLIYTGIAQGKVRISDGSWRTSSICEYEFDPALRAMLDYDVTELNEKTKQKQKVYNGKAYGSTLARAIMEYQKTAKQRANTGARLRVIRELTGMPVAFTAEQIKEPVLFGRIVQNTGYILQTPEGRAMATAQALGVDISTLFGGRKAAIEAPLSREDGASLANENDKALTMVEAKEAGNEPPPDNAKRLAEEAVADDEPSFGDDDDGEPNARQPNDEFDRLTMALEEYMTFKEYLDIVAKNGKNPYQMAQAELTNNDATVESRKKMLEKVRNWLIAKKVKGIA